jgi:hypothetical protein
VTVAQGLLLKAGVVAKQLTMERHYMVNSGGSFVFDPRYLVFEFTYDLLLRCAWAPAPRSHLTPRACAASRRCSW